MEKKQIRREGDFVKDRERENEQGREIRTKTPKRRKHQAIKVRNENSTIAEEHSQIRYEKIRGQHQQVLKQQGQLKAKDKRIMYCPVKEE